MKRFRIGIAAGREQRAATAFLLLSLAAGLLLAGSAPVAAHIVEPVSSLAEAKDVAGRGVPWTALVPLAASALLYARGIIRLWSASGAGRGIGWGSAACFAAGWATLALALLSPLDTAASKLFWTHMVQHELLMLVAAPLLVLGRPLHAWLWAFGPSARRRIGTFGRTFGRAALWRFVSSAGGGWVLHGVTLWVWHAPPLFDAALVRPWVHDLQHVSFLAGALAFWWGLAVARARHAWGAGVLYLFTTMVHTSVLGALLTFARVPWYAAYLATAPSHGLTALEDQQLGGLIMWVPGSIVYVGASLALLARLLTPARAAPGRRLT